MLKPGPRTADRSRFAWVIVSWYEHAPPINHIELSEDFCHCRFLMPNTVCRYCGAGDLELDFHHCTSDRGNRRGNRNLNKRAYRTPLNTSLSDTVYDQSGKATRQIQLRKQQYVSQRSYNNNYHNNHNKSQERDIDDDNQGKRRYLANKHQWEMSSQNTTVFNQRNKQVEQNEQRLTLSYAKLTATKPPPYRA
jgi:hypothetical protein